MAEIIAFKPKTSIAYNNMLKFFEVCNNEATCAFYLDTVEILARDKKITESEKLTLRRVGRQKKEALSCAPGTYLYTPEMGQKKPSCDLEATLSRDGKHYLIKSKIELSGQGIRPDNYTDKEGRSWYYVTEKAYQKLKKQYSISMKCYLD